MTPRHTALDERAVEQLLTGGAAPGEAELQRLVTLVRSLGTGQAPPPSPALARLLDSGFHPDVVPLRPTRTRRTWGVRAGAAVTAAAASFLVAGTAQALPAPVQNGLADLVAALTPFELPRPELPASSAPGGPTGDPAPFPAPGPSPVPAPSAPATATTAEDGPDVGPDGGDADRTPAERQERDRQRTAEETADDSPDAQEDDADEGTDDADDAAEDAARAGGDATREAEEAAEQPDDDREAAEELED